MTRAINSSRRAVLKRGAAGAASVAALALAAGASQSSPQANAARPDGTSQLRLVGRSWHADTMKSLPRKGDRYAVYGELHDGSGTKVGEFFSQNVGVDSPFQITGEGVGSFEIHTLSLAGGTIVGVGIGGGAERTFAIVGGTGKYTGARGSYLARQDTIGLGGRGTAELLLTILE